MNQSETKCNISTTQEKALALALVGESDVDIASACKVSRVTLWRWKNEDASYIAEFNRRKQALWAASEQKLLNLIPKALEVLEEQMTSENESRRVQAAVHILKATSFYDALHVSQINCLPVTEEEIEKEERGKIKRGELDELLSF